MFRMDPVQVVNRFFAEAWNQRRLEILDEIIDPACVTHQLRSAPGPIASTPRGSQSIREHIGGWLVAFPDIVVTVDQQTISGAQVVSWLTMCGTHKGKWQGVPPTGREVTIRTVVQHRVAGDRIVEDWVLVESLGFFQQLGLVPSTSELLATTPPGAA
jgi:predicted ester cyclase